MGGGAGSLARNSREDGDRAGEADPLRSRRDRSEDDRRGRDREVGAVVLADAEDVEPDLLGQLGLLEHLP